MAFICNKRLSVYEIIALFNIIIILSRIIMMYGKEPTHQYVIHKSPCNILHAAQDSCLTTNGSGLPVFKGYNGSEGQAGGPDRRIHHQHQAIITSYKFNIDPISPWLYNIIGLLVISAKTSLN